MGGRGLRSILTAAAIVASTLGMVGCSSSRGQATETGTKATRTDMVACAAVDAVYSLLSHHETVPSAIAQRVISSGASADSARLEAEARSLRADVSDADQSGVDEEMNALGTTCNSLGVGPSKY